MLVCQAQAHFVWLLQRAPLEVRLKRFRLIDTLGNLLPATCSLVILPPETYLLLSMLFPNGLGLIRVQLRRGRH